MDHYASIDHHAMRSNSTNKTWLLAIPLLLSFACSHDTNRDNPLDPELTPVVELAVAMDDSAGTATLTWSRYAGGQPFAAYWVLRRPRGLVNVDTLAVLEDASRSAFIDSTLLPNTAYEYRISVVNESGYEATTAENGTAGYSIEAVGLRGVEIDSQSGSATVLWTRYTNARFEAYRVERRRPEDDDFSLVERITTIADTSFVDAELQPDVSYIYRIVVEAAGLTWPSNRSGRQSFSLEAVELLSVEQDSNAGAMRLTWSAFRGSDFEAYEVHRVGVESNEDIIVGELDGLSDTTFVDQTLTAGVPFEYLVTVRAAGQVLTGNSLLRQLNLPAVEIESIEVNSMTASAILNWTPYAGPRFSSYRVLRRTDILAPEERTLIRDVSQVTFVDSGLTGNTEYIYSVEVVTALDEAVASPEQSAVIHPLVASWPLELDPSGVVRLYGEEDGISALVARNTRVRLLRFDGEGLLADELDLLGAVFGSNSDIRNLLPRSASIARFPNGNYFFSISNSREHSIYALDSTGDIALTWETLFPDTLVGLTGAQAVISGDIQITVRHAGDTSIFSIDNLSVYTDETELVSENFDGANPPRLHHRGIDRLRGADLQWG